MTTTPVWVQIVYLVAAVLFILALKGLSSPKHARRGNLLGAIGAMVAVTVVFFYANLDNTTDGREEFFLISTTAPPPVIPEPASMTLLGTGLVGIASAIRRRRNQKKA
jgi:NAD/NADP transhydrogenase beta subunit